MITDEEYLKSCLPILDTSALKVGDFSVMQTLGGQWSGGHISFKSMHLLKSFEVGL